MPAGGREVGTSVGAILGVHQPGMGGALSCRGRFPVVAPDGRHMADVMPAPFSAVALIHIVVSTVSQNQSHLRRRCGRDTM